MPYVDINSGIIQLDAEITYENSVHFLATFRQMEHSDKISNVTLHITSHGGALMPSVAIIQAMRVSLKNVSTVGAGYVASVALPILAAGTPGKRAIIEGTKLLLHKPTNMLAETSKRNPTIEIWKHEILFLESIMDQYYWALENCSGRDAGFWKKLLTHKPSRLIEEDEATKWGLVDHVVPLHQIKRAC